MKPLPDSDDGDYYGWDLDYDTLIKSFEVETLVSVYDSDYQGDARYLLRDGDRYGLLFFGWGSCSGCDALQATNSREEATELRDSLWNEVHWEPTRDALAAYVRDKDWKLEWYGHDEEQERFLTEVRKVLAGGSETGGNLVGDDGGDC